MSAFNSLPTVAQMRRQPCAKPKYSEPTRLETKWTADKLRVVDAKVFRQEVIARDGKVCRCCGRTVIETRARVPNRLEVHHCHGRIGALRYEARCALVLCLFCHAKVTGKVSERWVIVPSKAIVIDGRERIDARARVFFRRAA